MEFRKIFVMPLLYLIKSAAGNGTICISRHMVSRIPWVFSIVVIALSLSFKSSAHSLISKPCNLLLSDIEPTEKEMVVRNGHSYNINAQRDVLLLYSNARENPKPGDYLVIQTSENYEIPLKVVYMQTLDWDELHLNAKIIYSSEEGLAASGTFKLRDWKIRGIYPSEVIRSQKISLNGKTFDFSDVNSRAQKLEKLVVEYRTNPMSRTYAFLNKTFDYIPHIAFIESSGPGGVIYQSYTSTDRGSIPFDDISAPILFQ